jgi:hypothetical protein
MRNAAFLTLCTFALACGAVNAQRLPPPLEKINYQAGDVILLRSSNTAQKFITGFVTRGEITHAGLVIMGEDGKTLQLAEVLGNNDGISFKFNPGPQFGVVINPLLQVLQKERDVYNQELFILPRKNPITPEQSEALTAFAYNQEKKHYSSPGVLGPSLLSPFKNRPIKQEYKSYMCSSFVCAALVAADILPADFNPPAVAPFDFYDPSRFTRTIEIPKIDRSGNVVTKKIRNIFTGKVIETPIMVSATENAIKDGWKPAGTLTLLPPKP